MVLYSYFRSSAAYRVRIGLNLKGLDYQIKPVHLLKDGGQQHQPDYVQINPVQLLPALDDDGLIITQSLAILEYLDERYPELPLLPKASAEQDFERILSIMEAPLPWAPHLPLKADGKLTPTYTK